MNGSDLIDPVMQGLHDEGVIEYRRLGGIPAAEMVEVIRSADIVLEQFRLGMYAVAACEALAAERLVVGHVSARVRDFVRDSTGLEIPVVESTADRLESVIRDLLDDREHARRHAALGRDYVFDVHDGRCSAAVLAPFLGTTVDDGAAGRPAS